MTPDRFVKCLDAIHWSNDQLAAILRCDEGLIEAWALGLEEVPADVAIWLEPLAAVHEAASASLPQSVRGAKALPPTAH